VVSSIHIILPYPFYFCGKYIALVGVSHCLHRSLLARLSCVVALSSCTLWLRFMILPTVCRAKCFLTCSECCMVTTADVGISNNWFNTFTWWLLIRDITHILKLNNVHVRFKGHSQCLHSIFGCAFALGPGALLLARPDLQDLQIRSHIYGTWSLRSCDYYKCGALNIWYMVYGIRYKV